MSLNQGDMVPITLYKVGESGGREWEVTISVGVLEEDASIWDRFSASQGTLGRNSTLTKSRRLNGH